MLKYTSLQQGVTSPSTFLHLAVWPCCQEVWQGVEGEAWMAVFPNCKEAGCLLADLLSSHQLIQILIPAKVYPLNSRDDPGVTSGYRPRRLSAVSNMRRRECHYLYRLLRTWRTGDSCGALHNWYLQPRSKMQLWGCINCHWLQVVVSKQTHNVTPSAFCTRSDAKTQQLFPRF